MVFTFSTMSRSEVQVRLAPECLNGDVHYDTSINCNPLTVQEVQDLIKKAVSDNAEIKKFSFKSYSDGKLGFLGSYQQLSVDIKTVNGNEILYFFVKMVPYEVPSQAEYVLDKRVFLKEKIFYRDIVPQLYHGYKGKPWSPTCYIVKENLLVFEDLSVKGYTLRDKLFDKELIVSGLTALARLHACSLLAEARLGMSLKKMHPSAFVENAFSRTGKTRTWFDVGVKAIVAVAEHLGLDGSMIPKACEKVFPAMEMSPTKKNVVSHGDLWGNNLMFSNSEPLQCVLIDFQLLRYAPLAHDVTQFLYLCTERNFRSTWEETMLKYYYSVLCETLKSSKTTMEIPSWSELIQGVEEQRLGASITANLYFQTVLMDKHLSAEILDDPDSYHEFEFKTRSEIILKTMKIDPVYNRRIADAVKELVEFSFRLDQLPKPM
ncbi:uncharacterized protein LOC114879128 [Osmia bicornis bicornis]|uniref:uncharacterized protein LOC114879128 n=1 Tax=Osmia bicornis bicornis TaxID=1437191 RepID=UPI001EAF2453|nr:uncharacterized protein LOC114879128 [Osmia bicornis bicornis]